VSTASDAPRRVLFLAYHFPPRGGAGVQRSVKFVRYLPEFSFSPAVVTGPLPHEERSPPDPSLAAEVPDSVPVFRIGGPCAAALRRGRVGGLRGYYYRLLRVRGPVARAWVDGCVETGRRAAGEVGADLVFATMSPFETAEAGERLARALGIPWVADLRDPWALDEMVVYSTRWHRAAELRRMRRRLSSAARIIMNTPEAARALCERFPEFADGRVTTITNGFDPEDFREPAKSPSRDVFRIVHTGHLHLGLARRHARTRVARRILGGELVPVDVSTRSHLHLIRALERWRLEDPTIAGRVELVLAGAATAEDRSFVERSPVSAMVRLTGYLEHAASISLLRSASLLFLPMHRIPEDQRARIVPGKTYEYLAARRPILAAVPAGDAEDFVAASGRGTIVAPGDVEGILAGLKLCHRNHLECADPPADDDLRRFERRNLTSQLAHTLRVALGEATCRT
jgi:hypothetical protein